MENIARTDILCSDNEDGGDSLGGESVHGIEIESASSDDACLRHMRRDCIRLQMMSCRYELHACVKILQI